MPALANSPVSVKEFVNKDNSTWVPHVSSLSPAPSVLFSGLATTRANAGSFEAQYKLEHDLNVEIAKAAKQAGTKTCVIISANSSNANSYFPYVRMKGEIEEHIKEVGFDHTIIVRPGLISGRRDETRFAEGLFRGVAAGLGKISTHWLKDFWAQDADVIARAAINAAVRAKKGEVKDKVWILEQKDIVRLGRTEWKPLH